VPELPDIVVYMEALERRVVGHVLERVLVAGPFLLRWTPASHRQRPVRLHSERPHHLKC